ncbi:MAG: methyltransferase domain-containing protein [Chthoniobacterales bacterium]
MKVWKKLPRGSLNSGRPIRTISVRTSLAITSPAISRSLRRLRTLRSQIPDIWAHWLHNAFFYANRGHHLTVTDAADTLERLPAQEAARAMGAEIRFTKRLQKADGLVDLPENSIDVVLLCEVIEHLAFNPIFFWTQVYRVLRTLGAHYCCDPQRILSPIAVPAHEADDERRVHRTIRARDPITRHLRTPLEGVYS